MEEVLNRIPEPTEIVSNKTISFNVVTYDNGDVTITPDYAGLSKIELIGVIQLVNKELMQ